MSGPVEMYHGAETERGVLLFVRAPGYAWDPSFSMYRPEGTVRFCCPVPPPWSSGRRTFNSNATSGSASRLASTSPAPSPPKVPDAFGSGELRPTHASQGERLEGLEPGNYAISVELGSWRENRPVLAREELILAAGEERTIVLPLMDSPEPPVPTTLEGMLAFPDPAQKWGAERVRLRFFASDYRYGEPDLEFHPGGHAAGRWLPIDLDLPPGGVPQWRYQAQLVPS